MVRGVNLQKLKVKKTHSTIKLINHLLIIRKTTLRTRSYFKNTNQDHNKEIKLIWLKSLNHSICKKEIIVLMVLLRLHKIKLYNNMELKHMVFLTLN